MTTPFQPVLPAPVPFTEAELNFTDEEPPRIFPQNQNSNWGLVRRIFSNRLQEIIDQVSTLYNEMFVDTSTMFLDRHEFQYGLPVAPGSKTLTERRELVKARLATGPFTIDRRKKVVESFITATFGAPIQFSPSGVAFVATGIPFYGEAGDLSTLYRIVEDIPNFHYQVRIKNTVTPDDVGLHRELDRITPAGYSYDVTYVAVP